MVEVALNNSQYFYDPKAGKRENKSNQNDALLTQETTNENVVRIPESSVYTSKVKAQTPLLSQTLPPLLPQNSGMMSPFAVYGTIAAVGAIGLGVICHKTKGLDKINKLLAKGEAENTGQVAKDSVIKTMTPNIKNFAKDKDVKSLDELCGLKKIKEAVEDFETYFDKHQHYEAWGASCHPNCILMWGPGGTGKTSAAKGIAKKLNADFIEVNLTDIDSEYFSVGSRQAEELLEKIDKYVTEHPNKKVVMFMDECDSIFASDTGSSASHSQQIMNVFKTKIEEKLRKRNNLFIIGATNKSPDNLFSDNQGMNMNKTIVSRFTPVEISVPNKDAINQNLQELFGKKINGQEMFEQQMLNEISGLCADMQMSYRQIRDCFESFVAKSAKFAEKDKTPKLYREVLYEVMQNNESLGKDPWTMRTLFTETGTQQIMNISNQNSQKDISKIEKEVADSGETIKAKAMIELRKILGLDN